MTAAERGSPQRDPIRVDAVGVPGPVDHRAVVVLLTADVQELARLAAGAAEVPVVEQHHGQTGVGEGLGVRGQPVVAGSRKSV